MGELLSIRPIAIIPARAGSKRLPGKNVRKFFGHPMLAYAISAALNSGIFAEVIVSSDDASIGRIAEWYGAKFLPRPVELASDSAGLVEVAKHVLEVLRNRGVEPAAICQCMPNCPLIKSEDIARHWRLFNDENRRFQISVVPYRGVYPHWAIVPDERQRGQWLLGDKYLGRSQEIPKAFCPTGAIWWARTADFLEQSAYYGSPFHVASMDANRGIDIDDEEDLKLAELMVHGLMVRDGVSPLEAVKHGTFALESLSA
jgi:CMP-N-acetylneuraminic acid synthetase